MIGPGIFDFADFGCSNGASIAQAQGVFGGGRGLGIDISGTKVANARAQGLEVLQGDLTKLEVPDEAFRFVTMVHFLEHLPSFDLACKCIATAVRTSRDFVFIRQPWFSSDAYLATLGLKLYWSDWSGHTNRMDVLDFYLALRDLPKPDWQWRIYGRYMIKGADDPSIHPLGSGQDQHAYDAAYHGAKSDVDFSQPVFKETVCVLCRPELDPSEVMSGVSSLTPLLRSEQIAHMQTLKKGLVRP